MKMQVKVMSLITVCALLSMALFAFGCTGTTGKNDGSGVTGEDSFGMSDRQSRFQTSLPRLTQRGFAGECLRAKCLILLIRSPVTAKA